MKDIILEKLSRMEDLEQRKLLRNIMSGFFENLIDYQTDANEKLEKRIFDEVEDIERKFDVYTTVIHRENIDPIDEFFFPMIADDVEEKEFDFTSIQNKLNCYGKVFYETVFLKFSNEELEKINEKKFFGKLITQDGEVNVKIELRKNKRYVKLIENLFTIFEKNTVGWRTINSPYLQKIYDVYIVTKDEIDSEIEEVIYSIEEYEDYKHTEMIPVWNIERLIHKGDSFPMPALDEVHYEHPISLRKYGEKNGYLIDPGNLNINAIKKTKDKMVVITDRDESQTWGLYKIVQGKMNKNKKYSFEIYSNSKKESFINKYVQRQNSIIRTRSEIKRILESFECSDKYIVKNIEIEEVLEKNLTYDLNHFIADDIRIGNDKKIMKVSFENKEKDYIAYDLLSFLISELQMYFPEYICQGEII